jgi:hypothetical protein
MLPIFHSAYTHGLQVIKVPLNYPQAIESVLPNYTDIIAIACISQNNAQQEISFGGIDAGNSLYKSKGSIEMEMHKVSELNQTLSSPKWTDSIS